MPLACHILLFKVVRWTAYMIDIVVILEYSYDWCKWIHGRRAVLGKSKCNRIE